MRPGMPRPWASPRTSWDLPAPRSPVRPITQPGRAVFAHASPTREVSSGEQVCTSMMPILREVDITGGDEVTDAFFVADFETRFSRDLADATQPKFRKLLFPRIKQRHSILARRREQ